MSSVKRVLMFLGFLILPLVWWPAGQVRYEIPKVWFFNRLVEIYTIVFLIDFLKKGINLKKIKVNKLVFISLSGYVLSLVLASVLGADFNKSFWGNFYRRDGLFTWWHLIVFSFLLSFDWKLVKKEIIWGIVGGSFLVSLWTVWRGFKSQVLGMWVEQWQDRGMGVSFGNPNFLASYLVISLPFILYLVEKQKRRGFKILKIIAVVILAKAVWLTKSKMGWVGLGLVLFLWFLKKRHLRKFWLLGLLGVMVFGFLTRQKTFSFVNNDPAKLVISAESRERIYIKGLKGFLLKPVLGWGAANFDYAFEAVDWPMRSDMDVYVDKAHNSIIENLVSVGVVGTVFYLSLISGVLLGFIKSNHLLDEALLVVLVVYLVYAQINILSINSEAIFWVLVSQRILNER